MSNLITNGDFSLPDIATNSPSNVGLFTAPQLADFFWTPVTVVAGNTNLLFLCDGTGGTFHQFPNVSAVNKTQFLSIRSLTSVSQMVNITQVGNYHLQFYFSPSNFASAVSNYVSIYFNDVIIDTLTSLTPSTWVLYQKDFSVKISGNS